MFDKKTNIAAQEAFAEAVNRDHLEDLNDVVAADSVDHDPAPGQVPGPQGFRDFFVGMRAAFPDLHIEVVHLLATDDDVAFAYTITGTNNGSFQGNEPTGKSIKVRGMQISRFSDGKLVERWGSSDELGIMTQLGLLKA